MLVKGACGDPAIEVRDLTKIYGGFIAVDHISFSVRKGELFGFLGPNGAGKTTTVRMLVGLTRISGGEASVCGFDVAHESKKVKQVIGVVPDSSNMYYELTCLQNLVFTARMHGLGRGEALARAEEVLRFFGLWEMRNRKFKALSKGLKRRLTIAAALVHEPGVLFLDEPTSGLDVVSRRLLWRKLKELNSRGITIFLTTHNVYEAFSIAGRIAVINRGRLVAVGSPEELARKFPAREAIEVSFSPSNPDLGELSRLRGVLSAFENNGRIELIVSDTEESLASLAAYAKKRGLKISFLRLKGADAEELFLRIIGDGQ